MNHFITDICEHLTTCVNERVEQVILEVERNPEDYPEHASLDSDYREARPAFEENWPEARMALDQLISLVNMRHFTLVREAYKQGARDCAELISRIMLTPNDAKGSDRS